MANLYGQSYFIRISYFISWKKFAEKVLKLYASIMVFAANYIIGQKYEIVSIWLVDSKLFLFYEKRKFRSKFNQIWKN